MAKKEDYPHPQNFCGGNYQDWLEVLLTEHCNGHCVWCVEKHGFHPKYHAPWEEIVKMALETEKTNIMLLGGEPTLYEDLNHVIHALRQKNRKVYLTTNGSMLTPQFIEERLTELTGLNISIHHYKLPRNQKITGIALDYRTLSDSIERLQSYNIKVRLNCNLIKGQIDSRRQINAYILFAKILNITQIRFAELKLDEDHFVNLHTLFGDQFGLNEDPYHLGCNTTAIINDVEISFRQMCGFQIPCRPCPQNPKQYIKHVLYYDGQIYNGWQQQTKEMNTMNSKNKKEIAAILQQIKDQVLTVEEGNKKIEAIISAIEPPVKVVYEKQVGGCTY
jgi:organic radical activating enzyme